MPETTIPHFNLTSTLDYSKLEVTFESLLARYESADKVYRHLGRDVLSNLITSSSPETQALLQDARNEVDTAGMAILGETRVEQVRDEVAQLTAIAISSVFGTPTQTDQKDHRIAWPIHFDPHTNLTRTYSQSLGEASFHTDTQFFERPEKYFGMFCVFADEPGKGTSELLDGRVVMERYREEHGDTAYSVLGQKYPFKVPSVFTRHARDDDLEVTWAPIYDSNDQNIRYRFDTIADALQIPGIDINDEQLDAIQKINELLDDFEPIQHHLLPGEAILIDNHRMLHARTAFDNPARFLYRVRMDNDYI